MNPLLKRFASEQKAFGRLLRLSEAKVVRWKYWETPDWSWDPEEWLEYWQPPQHAPKRAAPYHYGYDDKNRVVLIRGDVLNDGDENSISHQFLRYSDNKIIGSEFQGKRVCDVFEAILSHGRVVRVERLFGKIWDWKSIEWQGGQVARAIHAFRGRKPHRELTYNRQHKVIGDIDLLKQKRKPLPAGVTLKSLTKTIRGRLVNAVGKVTVKARIKQPVYCVALNYDCEGNDLLLPELGIGLDSERQAMLKRGGRDAKLAIWDPQHFSLFANRRTQLDDPELERACDLFNRELRYRGSSKPARDLLLQVAADLCRVNWSGKLNTTDDFIAYAVDTDGADLLKNLKGCVPPKQLAKLKSEKLI